MAPNNAIAETRLSRNVIRRVSQVRDHGASTFNGHPEIRGVNRERSCDTPYRAPNRNGDADQASVVLLSVNGDAFLANALALFQ